MVHHALGVPKRGAWALYLALFLNAGKDGRVWSHLEECVLWSWRSVSQVTSD